MPFPTPHLRAGRPATHPSELPPTSTTLPTPRTQEQADKYFRRVANENAVPSRFHRWLSVGGWVVGGVACTYMVLFANFGDKEHVFSPVRRQFRSYTSSIFNLSESERSMMSLPFEDPVRKPARTASTATTISKKATGVDGEEQNGIQNTGKGLAGPMNGEGSIRGRFV